MAPVTRASPRIKAKKSNNESNKEPTNEPNEEPKEQPKKEPKRKRKLSENKDSKEQSQNKEEKDKKPNKKDNKNTTAKEEHEYGKFETYNKQKTWKLKKIPHHLIPSFNINKFTDILNYRSFPLVQVALPHSLYVNSKFSDAIDICHRRTIALNSYMTRVKVMKTAYLAAKRKHKNIRKDEKKGIYYKAVLDFAERRELHPDKYFVQDYDFYYTGGNLCVNKKSNQIAHVAGTNMNTLVLSVLNVYNNIPKLHKLCSTELKNDNKDNCEIFEVQSSLCDSDFWYLRQKLCVSVQNFSNGKINLLQNFRTKDVPFISFTQDIVNTHHLTISDLIHKVRVCDIEKGVPIQTIRMMPREEVNTSNNWNMIKSLDSHVYIYSMCKKVSVIDTRSPESEWQSNYIGSGEEYSCYSFCSLARSKFDNLFYVASNHKAYCIDRRYMGKDVESKNAVVTTWTHQMSSFPLMMATCCFNDTEYIALQSPLNSDLRICENMQFLQESETESSEAKRARTELPPEYSYKSPCLPYMPPSLESIFQQARLNGDGIKQGTGICDRVKACTTGLDFTDDIACPYLISATSNGDVFARQIYNPDDDIKPDTSTPSDVISKFEENIFRSVRKTPIAVTDVFNMSGISKVFRCSLLGSGSQEEKDLYSTKRKYMGRWQKSIYSLSKYKDALATDLFSIWDFNIEDERGLNMIGLNKTEPDESKVSGWLENTPDIAGHSTMLNMTSIPMDVFNSTNINSTLGDTSLLDLDQTESTLKINLSQTATAKPKTAKKKSRYVKGF